MELLAKVQDLKYIPHVLEHFNKLDENIIHNGYTQKEIATVHTCY